MAIKVQPYAAEQEKAVREFNQRLKNGGCPFQFPENSRPKWLPPRDNEPVYEQYYLACEDEMVRGGYILKRQPFWNGQAVMEAGCVYLPLSEGVVDSRFSPVALQMLMNALKAQPRLFSLGMGGSHQPYPRLLKAAGWSLSPVPFYFKVIHPNAFLKNFNLLRKQTAARIVMDALAVTGLGWVGIKCLQGVLPHGSWRKCRAAMETVSDFGDWADTVWEKSRNHYTLAAVRNAALLNRLYPPDEENFLKLKVTREGEPIGWAVMRNNRFPAHKQFGQMRIGSVIDCLAVPGEEPVVVQAATQLLEEREADIIVTNQSHQSWGRAFIRSGYWSGPSNFIFAGSPKMVKDLDPFAEKIRSIHFTRGDGEGPSHL
jgi:hypothetical protein